MLIRCVEKLSWSSMAKKNSIPVAYLFIGGTLLISLAWLMPTLPVFALIGFAPFMAIVANNPQENSLWNYLELVLLGLFISFFSAALFDPGTLVQVILLSITYTLPFLGFAFSRRVLGNKTSIITLLLYWLAVEYILVKWGPSHANFLANLMSARADWTRWNTTTGYLGASFWILICNFFVYKAFLTNQKVSWLFVSLFLVTAIGAIFYSLTLEGPGLTLIQMTALYEGDEAGLTQSYVLKGEFIARTSAWVSVLILLFTFVRNKANRKK